MIFGTVKTADGQGALAVAAVAAPHFPREDETVTLWFGPEVLCSLGPDEAVALGVALIQAASQRDLSAPGDDGGGTGG